MTNTMIKRNGNAAFGLDNVLDNFFGSSFRRFLDGNFWDVEKPLTTGSVPVNLKELEHHYEMEVIAPGLRKEDFSVQVHGNTLTVSFERKEENNVNEQGWSRTEFVQQSFQRSFTMDDTVDAAGIKAGYTDGILRLEIPKSEQARQKNRLIQIQ